MKGLLFTLIALTLTIFSCQSDEPDSNVPEQQVKLDYYIDAYSTDESGFEPSSKTAYEYTADGKLDKYTVYSYNADSKSFGELRHFQFEYAEGNVSMIKGYRTNEAIPYVSYVYQYESGKVTSISESNEGTAIDSEASFTYIGSDSLKVGYTFSNGGSFEYTIRFGDGNIIIDKTTRGSQLCSKGVYAYDSKINPFSTLGYVDYFLNNLSSNNKLEEAVQYVGCAFPTLIPESYTYKYNGDNFPTEVITTYKSESQMQMRREYFYK